MNTNKKDKLRKMLIEIKKFKLDMEEGQENITSIEDKFTEFRESMQEMLEVDENSREYKLFRNWYQGNADLHWRSIPRPGSKVPTGSKKIDALQEIIEKLLSASSVKEISFSKDEDFQAINYLRKIIKKAQNKIVIIDGYLDDTVFDLIEEIDDKVSVYLLTHDKVKIFERLFTAFAKTKKNVFAKVNTSSHDRYIIIDDKDFYHIGASLNTIGKKDFMINEIETEAEKQRKLRDYIDWWSKGKRIN